jgi:hypothetical protein
MTMQATRQWIVTPPRQFPVLTFDRTAGHAGQAQDVPPVVYTDAPSTTPGVTAPPLTMTTDPSASPAWPWWKILLAALAGGGLLYVGYRKYSEYSANKVLAGGRYGGYGPGSSRKRLGAYARATSSYGDQSYRYSGGRGGAGVHPEFSGKGRAGERGFTALPVLAIAGLAGVGAFLLFQKHAAASPGTPKVLPPTRCPDGSSPLGGDVSTCPPPHMGTNDPDSPPGGWSYNAPVAPPSLLSQTAAALAAVDPCDPKNVQLVRNFQSAAGLAQINGGPGWDQVSPPGTDGRYGGDTAKALAQYVQTAPAPCYSNANPSRPAWWGAPGTYTNLTPAA